MFRVSVLLFICFFTASPSLAQSDQDRKTLIQEVENAIVSQTNDFRQSKDLSPLSTDDDLRKTASKFARFMAEREKYGHRADGRTPAQRAKASGYQYCVVRENIAYRTNTGDVKAESLIEVFVQGWIDSPSHRENMLADYITETGVAVATSDGITFYAVQLFGRPKSASFKIEITNRSDTPQQIVIQSDNSEDEIELPPRGIVRMKRCFPATIKIAGGDDPIQLEESANLVIEGDELRFVDG